MSITLRSFGVAGYISIFLGVAAGLVGFVRTASLLIAVGTAGVALSRATTGKVERYLPLAIALALALLALALPHGR